MITHTLFAYTPILDTTDCHESYISKRKAFVFQSRESTLPVSHADDSELSDSSSPEDEKKSKQQVKYIYAILFIYFIYFCVLLC